MRITLTEQAIQPAQHKEHSPPAAHTARPKAPAAGKKRLAPFARSAGVGGGWERLIG